MNLTGRVKGVEKGMTVVYEALPPDERLQMYLKAGARDDFKERWRLMDSCPMKPCRIVDPAFDNAVYAAQIVTITALIGLHGNSRCLLVIRLAKPLLEPLIEEANTGKASEATLEGLEQFATDFQDDILRHFKEEWLAFDDFCQSHFQMDGLHVIHAHMGDMSDRIAWTVKHCGHINAEVVEVERYRESMERLWTKIIKCER